MSKPFYILSVDGGGFRGLFAAHLLKRVEETSEIDWRSRFGLFAGTSTGAILSAGLAMGLSADKLTQFYMTHGKAIFKPRTLSRFDIRRLCTSRYSNTTLKNTLDGVFHDTTLGDIDIPLILPSVDIGNGCVHALKSSYHSQFDRDKNVRISDAVLASCSAPTYFDPHVINDRYQLVDGGLWANNPSLVAVIEAHYRLKISFDDIRVLAIGTGKSSTFYPRSHGKWKDRLIYSWQGWGFATRWGASKFINLILNLQSDNAHNMLSFLLGENPLEPKNVLRLTFESDQLLPLDSTEKSHDWVSKADHIFAHNAAKIRTFLSIERSKDEQLQ